MDISKHSHTLLEQFRDSQPPTPRRRHLTAVELEREECAKIAEHFEDDIIADAIRARGDGLRRKA